MMKKKISILLLTFLFLVSTTGLPVSYHLCQMMNEKSLSECEMCKSEMAVIETKCCNEKAFDNSLVIKSEKSTCCHEEFVYNKVDDEFVSGKSGVNNFSFSENLTQLTPTTFCPIDFSVEESFYCDSSPPFLINSDLHITNSVLLI